MWRQILLPERLARRSGLELGKKAVNAYPLKELFGSLAAI